MAASGHSCWLLALVAGVAAALGAATWWVLDDRTSPPPEIGGFVLPMPRPLPAVELVDEHGRPFRPHDFAGHWSLLYFGYTYCPDVCPLTLVALAAMKSQLPAPLAQRVEYYLVSVDPQRDTPARLREYVAYFDPSFHGLTGTPDALAALAEATYTLFEVPNEPDGDNYLVSHSSNVVLLDPAGQLYALFTPPQDPATMAADFTKVAEHHSGAD
jgi:protein SCO1